MASSQPEEPETIENHPHAEVVTAAKSSFDIATIIDQAFEGVSETFELDWTIIQHTAHPKRSQLANCSYAYAVKEGTLEIAETTPKVRWRDYAGVDRGSGLGLGGKGRNSLTQKETLKLLMLPAPNRSQTELVSLVKTTLHASPRSQKVESGKVDLS